MNFLENIEEQRAKFEEEGFLIMRDFLSLEELQDLRTNAQKYLDSLGTTSASSRKKLFAGTHKNLNSTQPWFHEQLHQGKPHQFVSELLQADIKPATAALFERIPGEREGIAPHFDAIGHRSWGATIWVALDPSHVSNGCLYYLKGSHHTEYPSKIGLENIDANTEGATPIELSPGDASLHSSLTVHWSHANKSEDQRRGVSYFYWCANSN